jgi:hypothetical protein
MAENTTNNTTVLCGNEHESFNSGARLVFTKLGRRPGRIAAFGGCVFTLLFCTNSLANPKWGPLPTAEVSFVATVGTIGGGCIIGGLGGAALGSVISATGIGVLEGLAPPCPEALTPSSAVALAPK